MKPDSLFFLVFLSLTSLPLDSASSQADFWRPTNGPLTPRQWTRALAVAESVILEGSWVGEGRIARSTDQGATWTLMIQGLSNQHVTALKINALGHAFAGTTDGYLFRTLDALGDDPIWSEMQGWTTRSFILSIAFNNAGDIFVGTENSIQRSTNDGVSWETISSAIPEDSFRALFVSSDQVIYTSPYLGSGIYRSTDNGDSWTIVGFADPNAYCNDITQSSNGYLFAGCGYADVYRSTDNGISWENRTVPGYIRALVCDSADMLFATGDLGVFKSTDYAESWEQLHWEDGTNLPYGYVMGSSPSGGIYVGTDEAGVVGSIDGGATWEKLYFVFDGVQDVQTNSMGVLFCSGYQAFHKTTDLGESWGELNHALGDFSIRNNGDLIALDYDWVVLSQDNGENWSNLCHGGYPLISLTTHPNGLILACWLYIGPGSEPNGFVRSTDGGVSWDWGLQNYRPEFMASHPSGVVFSAQDGVLHRSVNNGTNWILSTSGLVGSVQCIDFLSDGTTFAGTTEGIYVSTNLGLGWSRRSDLSETVNAICMDPEAHVFAATNHGVFQSLDSGYTWVGINSGLPDSIVTALTASPDGFIYAGTTEHGVYKSAEPTTSVLGLQEFPRTFLLSQNHPNPFNPRTTIRFSIPRSAEVSLKIFNLLGEEVATLVSGNRDPGTHLVEWDATGQPSGVYFYRLQAGEFTEARKLVLLR